MANLRAATELRLFVRSNAKVALADGVLNAVEGDNGAMISLLRRRVFDDSFNAAAWRSQVGARDLTNALSWFLTFAAAEAPIRQEGGPRSAEALQSATLVHVSGRGRVVELADRKQHKVECAFAGGPARLVLPGPIRRAMSSRTRPSLCVTPCPRSSVARVNLRRKNS